MTMLKAKPHLLAEDLRQELGLEVVAAYDGMSLNPWYHKEVMIELGKEKVKGRRNLWSLEDDISCLSEFDPAPFTYLEA